jgi:hypothetical protein
MQSRAARTMTATAEDDAPPRWQDDLYALLRANDVTQFAYVPDAGHRILIDRSLADPDAHSVALTTEEEGVALAVGAGIKRTMTIGAMADIPTGARLLREGNGTSFVLVRVATSPPPKFKRNLDPSSCRDRFRAALLT